jgi:hypothetical protein
MGNNLITGPTEWPARSPDLTGGKKRRCLKKKLNALEVSYEIDRLNMLEMQVDVERYKTC